MEYKGKLYGKVHKSYFPLEATTDEWDAMVKRIAFLEAENQALRQSCVVGRSEQLRAFAQWYEDNYQFQISERAIQEYERYGS
jgi:hypothetical protein